MTKPKNKPPIRTKTPRTLMMRARSAIIGVSTTTLAHWENDGCDIEDDESVKAHVAKLTRHPKTINPEYLTEPERLEETPDMAALKTSLLRTIDEREARRLATQIKGLADAEKLEILQSKFISLDEYQTANTKLGSTLKAALNKAQVDLPVMLYGRSQHEMQKAIRTYMDKLLETLSDKESEIWSAK